MYHHVKELMYTVNIESPREAEAHRSTRCRSRVPGDATRSTFSERFQPSLSGCSSTASCVTGSPFPFAWHLVHSTQNYRHAL